MTNPITYIQSVAAELRKVTWPTFPTVVKYFFSVVIGVGIGAVVIFAMDSLFIKAIGLIINN
jgi:preprotein translocase subunit SecE